MLPPFLALWPDPVIWIRNTKKNFFDLEVPATCLLAMLSLQRQRVGEVTLVLTQASLGDGKAPESHGGRPPECGGNQTPLPESRLGPLISADSFLLFSGDKQGNQRRPNKGDMYSSAKKKHSVT